MGRFKEMMIEEDQREEYRKAFEKAAAKAAIARSKIDLVVVAKENAFNLEDFTKFIVGTAGFKPKTLKKV